MAVQSVPMFIQADSHPSEDLRRMIFSLVGQRGGIVNAADLAVSQHSTPNMSVDVATGDVFIPGTEQTYQGVYFCENRGALNVAIAASDATNPRRDLIVGRIRDNAYLTGPSNTFAIEVVTGTPAGSPVDPTVPANCWVLARVAVAATVTTIVTGNITDLRTAYTGQQRASGLGGVITCTSTTVPTVNLQAGDRRWDTDTKSFYVYNGATWDLLTAVPTAWTAPTLLNSWVNNGGSSQVAQYRKVGDMVYVRGIVKSGTTGTTIFTLPVGFRPPALHIFPAIEGANVAGRFDIDSSGNVTHQTGSNAFYSLNAQFSVSS